MVNNMVGETVLYEGLEIELDELEKLTGVPKDELMEMWKAELDAKYLQRFRDKDGNETEFLQRKAFQIVHTRMSKSVANPPRTFQIFVVDKTSPKTIGAKNLPGHIYGVGMLEGGEGEEEGVKVTEIVVWKDTEKFVSDIEKMMAYKMRVYGKVNSGKWELNVRDNFKAEPIELEGMPEPFDVFAAIYPIVPIAEITNNLTGFDSSGKLIRSDLKLLHIDVASANIRRTKNGKGWYGQYLVKDDSLSSDDLKNHKMVNVMMTDPEQVCYDSGSELGLLCTIRKGEYDGKETINVNGEVTIPIIDIPRALEPNYLEWKNFDPAKAKGTLLEGSNPDDLPIDIPVVETVDMPDW